jgi:flagellar assembly protein FliH
MSPRARRISGGDAGVEPFEWRSPEEAAQQSASPVTVPRFPTERGRALRASAGASPGPSPDGAAHAADVEREAFAKGYAQGERAGLEAGAQRAEAMLRRLAGTIDELAELRRTIVRQTERQMVELALAVARRVVLREVALDPEIVAAMAHVALERLGQDSPATVRLNPDDYAAVMSHRGEGWAGSHVAVLPDAAVSRGGCQVESDFGLVDGSIDAQLQELGRAMLGEQESLVAVPHGE